MVSFNDIKEKLWLISIIAGILGFIAIVTPVWGYMSGGSYVAGWIFGLVLHDGDFDFISTDEPVVILGDYIAIALIVGVILLLVGGILSRKKDRDINLLYLIGGIILLGGIIAFMAGTAAIYSSWWLYYTVHIGAILAYIGGGLAIAAGVIGIMEKRK
ncbi:MAG: hypothetical protein ACFE9S_16745 [Candidatus Hermodarchaeota archaeon]